MQTAATNCKHPCHNQRVEHHAKLVTEASASVAGHDNRDGMIRQRIRSVFPKLFRPGAPLASR